LRKKNVRKKGTCVDGGRMLFVDEEGREFEEVKGN